MKHWPAFVWSSFFLFSFLPFSTQSFLTSLSCHSFLPTYQDSETATALSPVSLSVRSLALCLFLYHALITRFRGRARSFWGCFSDPVFVVAQF